MQTRKEEDMQRRNLHNSFYPMTRLSSKPNEHSKVSKDEMIYESDPFIIDPMVELRGMTLKQLVDALKAKISYDQLDSERKCPDFIWENHTSL